MIGTGPLCTTSGLAVWKYSFISLGCLLGPAVDRSKAEGNENVNTGAEEEERSPRLAMRVYLPDLREKGHKRHVQE